MFAGVCSLGNVCNMAPRHYEAEGIPPSSSLPHPACITPCIRSWPPLHGFWPPSSRCAIASIQEYFYPLRGRTRSVVNSKPWITSSKLAGGHLPKTMKLNLSRRTGKKKKKEKSASDKTLQLARESKSTRWKISRIKSTYSGNLLPDYPTPIALLWFIDRRFLRTPFMLDLFRVLPF